MCRSRARSRRARRCPGLFPPVEIDGRFYVDGALKRTLHASVALEQGVKLLLCINPLVPYDSRVPIVDSHAPRRLVDGGLPVVLAQTLRAMVHSRMQVGMQRYQREFRDADVVLFEPNKHDAEMFFTNMFSYASRRRLAEHAYQKTRKELFARRHALAPILARHGVGLRLDALTDPDRHLVRGCASAGASAGRRRLPRGSATRWTTSSAGSRALLPPPADRAEGRAILRGPHQSHAMERKPKRRTRHSQGTVSDTVLRPGIPLISAADLASDTKSLLHSTTVGLFRSSIVIALYTRYFVQPPQSPTAAATTSTPFTHSSN